jgi:hypothetical protein
MSSSLSADRARFVNPCFLVLSFDVLEIRKLCRGALPIAFNLVETRGRFYESVSAVSYGQNLIWSNVSLQLWPFMVIEYRKIYYYTSWCLVKFIPVFISKRFFLPKSMFIKSSPASALDGYYVLCRLPNCRMRRCRLLECRNDRKWQNALSKSFFTTWNFQRRRLPNLTKPILTLT